MTTAHSWLFVVGNLEAVDWIIGSERMAFRENIRPRADVLKVDDGFAIYVTTRALPSFGRVRGPQIAALGRVSSEARYEPVEVAGSTFSAWCQLQIEAALPPGDGARFRPLMSRLSVIGNRPGWQMRMMRTLIPLSAEDFELIREEFMKELTSRREKR